MGWDVSSTIAKGLREKGLGKSKATTCDHTISTEDEKRRCRSLSLPEWKARAEFSAEKFYLEAPPSGDVTNS